MPGTRTVPRSEPLDAGVSRRQSPCAVSGFSRLISTLTPVYSLRYGLGAQPLAVVRPSPSLKARLSEDGGVEDFFLALHTGPLRRAGLGHRDAEPSWSYSCAHG